LLNHDRSNCLNQSSIIKFPKPTVMSLKRACQSPPPATRSQTVPHDLPSNYTYVRGLSDRQRVDMVLQQMHEQHRWGLKSFLYYLVTAQPEEKHAWSTEYRARKLFEAIYEQEEVMTELHKVPENVESLRHSKLVKLIRKELAQFDKPEVGLGQFITDETVDQLHMPEMASCVRSTAPNLWALLVCIMTQQRPSARDTSQEYQGSIFMICMMLASAFAPGTCNKFLLLLGLHLHSIGVKRRTINLLHGLGVTPHSLHNCHESTQ
jgi:hypothetical protein